MMGFWDVFYNASAGVQIFMLLAALCGFALPCYGLLRWLHIGRADYLPEDALFAIRCEGDLLQLTFKKEAPMPREQMSSLMLELAATKNAPTDVQ